MRLECRLSVSAPDIESLSPASRSSSVCIRLGYLFPKAAGLRVHRCVVYVSVVATPEIGSRRRVESISAIRRDGSAPDRVGTLCLLRLRFFRPLPFRLSVSPLDGPRSCLRDRLGRQWFSAGREQRRMRATVPLFVADSRITRGFDAIEN